MKSDIYGTLIIGIVFLIGMWAFLDIVDSAPEKTPLVYIWNEDLCEQVPVPGQVDYDRGEVCYVPGYGWHESTRNSTLDADEYDELIRPLFRQVRRTARSMGLYDETHNLYMYRPLRARDSYEGRE